MKPVRIEEGAEDELAGSVDFYEHQRSGLGLEFALATSTAVRAIRANPTLCALLKDGTRRYVMERFPFTIRYMDLPDEIWIIAFAHTSREPNYWRPRLQPDS